MWTRECGDHLPAVKEYEESVFFFVFFFIDLDLI